MPLELPCSQEQADYLTARQKADEKQVPDQCTQAVLNKMTTFYLDCNDPMDFPNQFDSKSSLYTSPQSMQAFCLNVHAISLNLTLPASVSAAQPTQSSSIASNSPNASLNSRSVLLGVGVGIGALFVVLIVCALLARRRLAKKGWRAFMRSVVAMTTSAKSFRRMEEQEGDIPLYSTDLHGTQSNSNWKGYTPQDVVSWSVEQVCEWARSIPDMGADISHALRYNAVDGRKLLLLNRDSIRRNLGLVMSAAVALEAAVANLSGKYK